MHLIIVHGQANRAFEPSPLTSPLGCSDLDLKKMLAACSLFAAPCAGFVATSQPLRASSARRVAASPTALQLDFATLSQASLTLAEIQDIDGKRFG